MSDPRVPGPMPQGQPPFRPTPEAIEAAMRSQGGPPGGASPMMVQGNPNGPPAGIPALGALQKFNMQQQSPQGAPGAAPPPAGMPDEAFMRMMRGVVRGGQIAGQPPAGVPSPAQAAAQIPAGPPVKPQYPQGR